MGFSRTYTYEVQVENLTNKRIYIRGAMTYREALKTLMEEARQIGAATGYIWAQTAQGTRKIRNIDSRADYLKVDISINAPERTVYKVTGVSLQDEADKFLLTQGRRI